MIDTHRYDISVFKKPMTKQLMQMIATLVILLSLGGHVVMMYLKQKKTWLKISFIYILSTRT